MDSEASILLAITAVNDGLALKAAARQFGVPYSTLARRHQGGNSREHYRKGLQFLSPGEEEELVKLIHYMVSQGLPPVRRFIQQFARDASGRQIERSWFRGFISRHPEIKHLKAKKLESDRAAVTSDEIKEFSRSCMQLSPNSRLTTGISGIWMKPAPILGNLPIEFMSTLPWARSKVVQLLSLKMGV
jgi:hypothetical protein